MSSIKTRVLVMALVDPSRNPRPRRLINMLRAQGMAVHVASFAIKGHIDLDGHYEIPHPPMDLMSRLMRKGMRVLNRIFPHRIFESILDEWRWKHSVLKKKLGNQEFDLIVVEDLHLLPFVFDHFSGHRVIFDAREYYPEELEPGLLWNLIEKPVRTRLCRTYLPKCDGIVTVSPGLIQKYKVTFNVVPGLLRSVPNFQDIGVSESSSGKIRLVHHGIANRDRRLENIIDIFSRLDGRFELDLYLAGNPAYQAELRVRAEGLPGLRFLDPVPFDAIVPTLNKYDIGLCYFEPVTFNLRHCLPNKLFEFIQARLMVVSGPSPDIAEIIHTHRCGLVADEFGVQAMADMLNGLAYDDITRMKQASAIAARELCYEKEGQKLLDLVGNVSGKVAA